MRELARGPWLDDLFDRVDAQGVRLTGDGGFLPELVRAVLERGLEIELSDHLLSRETIFGAYPACRGQPDLARTDEGRARRPELPGGALEANVSFT